MTVLSESPYLTSSRCCDAGSAYCPCDLAVLGSCVACSLMRGEETCRCGWSGLCVYADLKRKKKPAPGRREGVARISARTDLATPDGAPRAFIMTLELDRHVAEWCAIPGSFLMVRPLGSHTKFNVPLSVMRVRGNLVELAIEVAGPKTLALWNSCSGGGIATVTGPYWSGLQEAARLRRYAGGRTLIVAKGIGQAPAVNAARYLCGHGGYLKILVGPGVLGAMFAVPLLLESGAEVVILPKSNDHNLGQIREELLGGGYRLLISEGSDSQHRGLIEICAGLFDPPAFCWSSNLIMTCAEGICGSCLVSGQRGCKASLDPRTALGL